MTTSSPKSPDFILRNGRFTTLNPSRPTATAVAITDGVFSAVGDDSEVMASRPATRKSSISAAARRCRA